LVLNAFRHQRSTQPENGSDLDASQKCSTPFGIKDQLSSHLYSMPDSFAVLNAFRHQRSTQAGSPDAAHPGHSVLNAFRHQRSTQCFLPSFSPGFNLCSTPFGIKDQLSSRVSGQSQP